MMQQKLKYVLSYLIMVSGLKTAGRAHATWSRSRRFESLQVLLGFFQTNYRKWQYFNWKRLHLSSLL